MRSIVVQGGTFKFTSENNNIIKGCYQLGACCIYIKSLNYIKVNVYTYRNHNS